MQFTIDGMRRTDWTQVRRIYREGLATGLAAFMRNPARLEGLGCAASAAGQAGRAGPRRRGRRLGGADAGAGHLRRAGVAEFSVYIESKAHRQGIGAALLKRLIEISEPAGYWTVQAQVIAGNRASRALLASCGFREVGRRERYGPRTP